MEFAQKHLGGNRGLGFDIDPRKVSRAIQSGHDAVCLDILKMKRVEDSVDFVILSHFLEHVDPGDAPKFILKAAEMSRKFIFIQQPFFDRSIELIEMGLKLSYSDWTGHRNLMTTLEILLVLKRLRERSMITEFSIGAFRRIESSGHDKIVPLSAPIDTINYSDILGAKEHVPLRAEIFEEVWAVASISGDHDGHSALARNSKLLFTSEML